MRSAGELPNSLDLDSSGLGGDPMEARVPKVAGEGGGFENVEPNPKKPPVDDPPKPPSLEGRMSCFWPEIGLCCSSPSSDSSSSSSSLSSSSEMSDFSSSSSETFFSAALISVEDFGGDLDFSAVVSFFDFAAGVVDLDFLDFLGGVGGLDAVVVFLLVGVGNLERLPLLDKVGVTLVVSATYWK